MLAAAANSISIGQTLVVTVGVVLGVPTSILAWHSLQDRTSKARQQRDLERQNQEELNRYTKMMAKQLLGEHAISHPAEPSPDNPSIRDLLHDVLGETAAGTAELAIIREMIRIHVSDQHGPPIPDYLMRK